MWFFRLIVARSSLIIGGIFLGLLARFVFGAPESVLPPSHETIPEAKIAYENAEAARQSILAELRDVPEESEQQKADAIGDYELSADDED